MALHRYARAQIISAVSIFGLGFITFAAISFLPPSAITPLNAAFHLFLVSGGLLCALDTANRLKTGHRLAPRLRLWMDSALYVVITFVIMARLLGLVPMTSYVHPVVLSFVVVIAYGRYSLDFWHTTLTHFITRAIHFAPMVLDYAMGLFWIYAFVNLQHIAQELRADSTDYMHLGLHVMKVAAAGLITHLVRAHVFHTRSDLAAGFTPAICVLVGLTVFIQVANVAMEQLLDPFWTYMPLILATILYVSDHVLRRVSEVVAKVGLMVAFVLIGFSITFDAALPSSDTWKHLAADPRVQWLTTVLVGILPPIVIGFCARLRQRNISQEDVREASEEIVGLHGKTVDSVDDILEIAILARDFSYCDAIADNSPFKGTVYTYFRMYLLGTKVKLGDALTVSDQAWLFDGESPQLDKDGLLRAYNDRYPEVVSERELARAFTENSYITSHIDPVKVAAVRSITRGRVPTEQSRIRRTKALRGTDGASAHAQVGPSFVRPQKTDQTSARMQHVGPAGERER